MVLCAALLVASPLWAQRPWEQRVDFPVDVPVALPTIPLDNPFFVAADEPATVLQTPLQRHVEGVFPLEAGIYVDAKGVCQRVVVQSSALPGTTSEVVSELSSTKFSPALLGGTPVPSWVTVRLDLAGRITGGTWQRLRTLVPEPERPPELEREAAPPFERRDLQLPASPVDALDQLPLPRRFRLRVGALAFSCKVRLAVEVGTSGTCQRVVFLACPEGLRPWLLGSAATWSFRAARRGGLSVASWVLLEGEVAVETSSLTTDALRVLRQNPLPAATP